MPIEPESVVRALDRRHRPLLTPQALLRELGGGGRERRALASILRRLVSEGRVERVRGRYRIARSDGLFEGVFERGAGGAPLVFDDAGVAWSVPEPSGIAAGERVVVEPIGTDEPASRAGAEPRAEVVRAIGGPRSQWIGILDAAGRAGVLRPYRDEGFWEFAVPRSAWRGARAGDVVVAVVQGARERGDLARRRAGSRAPRARGRRPAREPATARVVEDVKCLVLDARTLETMIKNNSEIALRLIKKLASRLDAADGLVQILINPDPQARVLMALKRSAESFGAMAAMTR